MTAKISMQGVTKAFGTKRVLRGVDLDVATGESCVIIGGSGTGKSVTLKCVIGLVRPDAGVIAVDGRPLDRRGREDFLRHFGMLFQGGALFDSLSVWENVAFRFLRGADRLPRAKARDLAIEKLRRVGLEAGTADLFPAELSGGMQKRVGLARAIATDPSVIFFDEPTTGLDPIMSDVINELIIRTARREQMTSVVVTHDMTTVRKVADRVVMFYPLSRLEPHEPQIIFEGTAEEAFVCDDPRVHQFVHGEAGQRLLELAAG
jgi:phospholipid/cholesterol/gamma-HCH transport system ATP-binding protein